MMLSLNRRTFLQYCSAVAGTGMLQQKWQTQLRAPWSHAFDAQLGTNTMDHYGSAPETALMHTLGQQAVDAAMASGAAYADVRLTHTVSESYIGGIRERLDYPADIPLVYRQGVMWDQPQLIMGIGIRAFVRGYWGFASSPLWTPDEAARLGQEAARQARTNAQAAAPREVQLGTVPVVRNGAWIMPGTDPFTVPVDEKIDWLQTMLELAYQHDRFESASTQGLVLTLWREARAFVSSEGSSYSQIGYRCPFGQLEVNYGGDHFGQFPQVSGEAEWSQDALWARGWDGLRDINLDTLVSRLVAEARHHAATDRDPGKKSVDVGKYDIVFDVDPVGQLLHGTLGVATQLDRSLGYEADAAGTSYLGPDPFQFLGTAVAGPNVTLTANRTTPGALATTHWDDEGIAAQSFPLITDGVLVDYQTTREQAHMLASWYEKRGMTVQSRGCARAATALDEPIQMMPNLILSAGHETMSVDDMIKETTRGVYFPRGSLQIDQQVRTGVFQGAPHNLPREIRNGKLGQALVDAGVLFTSLNLWKKVVALGGSDSAKTTDRREYKGQPSQLGDCTVTAVPIKVKDCSVINYKRRA
jgi:TldD protein